VDAPDHRAAEVTATSGLAGCAATMAVAVAAWRPRRRVRRPPPRANETERATEDHRIHRLVVIAAVATVGLALIAAAGPSLAVVAAATISGVVVLRRRTSRRASRQAIDAAMPDAIELLVICLHAGLTPTQAVGELARLAPLPVRPGFLAIEQRLHRGAGFADALTELTGHCGRSALALVAALGTAVRDGLPLAPVLDRLTDEANAGRRRAGEAAARRLPVRLSFPLVVCTLPSFVLLAIAPAVLGALSTVRGSAP
jgi:tight adherence protein C